VLKGQLGAVPGPPAPAAPRSLAQRTGAHRPLLADPLEHLGDELRALALHPHRGAPALFERLGPRHPPAQQRVQVDRQQRGLVPPVLEQLAAPEGQVGDQPGVVRPEPAEQRQVVGALEDVDRVDLQQVRTPEHPPDVPRRHRPGRRRVGKTLRR
jgi:hypothetical protein